MLYHRFAEADLRHAESRHVDHRNGQNNARHSKIGGTPETKLHNIAQSDVRFEARSTDWRICSAPWNLDLFMASSHDRNTTTNLHTSTIRISNVLSHDVPALKFGTPDCQTSCGSRSDFGDVESLITTSD